MATATPSRIPAQTQERIDSPLHKLRGAIRRYIVLEAVAALALCVSLFFWLGFALDYGSFKLFGVDYVTFMPHLVRWGVLGGFAAFLGLLLVYKLVRLFREFRPQALALVLERRFPKLLHDRLITAVELTDLDDAESCGYSRAMILQTVDEVSRLVDQIPIRQVFNWGRIWFQWVLIAVMTIVLLLVAIAADMGVHLSANPIRTGHRLMDSGAIWFERTVLVWDSYWPRRAYLELTNFPESGDLRVGRDAPSPSVQARALKWVVADRAAPDGWRTMVWSDLTPKMLGGKPVPPLAMSMETTFTAGHAPERLDEVELLFEALTTDTRLVKTMEGDKPGIDAVGEVLAVLDKQVADPAMSRTFRRLILPQEVKIYYWGEKSDNTMPMTRQPDSNDFRCTLTDLKESVKFYVKGEDYYTHPDRTITLVPPPMLTRLERDEEVPAYHYYRKPSDGKLEDLKGQKQLRTNVGTSLTGSTTRIEVESGCNMTLRGEVDKELDEVRIRYRTQKADAKPVAAEAGGGGDAPAGDAPEIVAVDPDMHGFSKRFENITRPIEFDFEFTDTDNVKSVRHIVIFPKEDRPPDVDVSVEVIRKTPQGYMCTAMAMIPFAGRVRDAEGLDKIDYTVNYMRVESAQTTGVRAAIAAGILGGISPSPTPVEIFTIPALADVIARLSESREAVVPVAALPLQTFLDMVKDRDREFQEINKANLLSKLHGPVPTDQDRRMIRTFEVKPNLEFLDLQERIPELLKAGENALIAPRFRMRVTIMATDNNVETGPRTGLNKETFTFLVVPYEELLGEIAKDDQKLNDKLNEVVFKLEAARDDIEKVISLMNTGEFRPATSRLTDNVQDVVVKNHDVVQEVFTECGRLLRELQSNRVPSARIESKQKISNLLDDALRTRFPAAEEANAAFLGPLGDGRAADKTITANAQVRMAELIDVIKEARDLLGSVSSTDQAAARLKAIIDGTREVGQIIKTLEQDQRDIIFHQLAVMELKANSFEIQKGERLVVAVDILRDAAYDGRYVMELKAPAGSNLTMPASVPIPRVAKQFQFEVIAGNTTGDFVIQVIPHGTDGSLSNMKPPYDKKPFEIRVKVK